MTSLFFFQGRGGCHLDLFSRRSSSHDCCLLFPYHCGDVRILWNSEKKSVASCMGMVFTSSLYYGWKDQPVLYYFFISAQDYVLREPWWQVSNLWQLFNILWEGKRSFHERWFQYKYLLYSNDEVWKYVRYLIISLRLRVDIFIWKYELFPCVMGLITTQMGPSGLEQRSYNSTRVFSLSSFLTNLP